MTPSLRASTTAVVALLLALPWTAGAGEPTEPTNRLSVTGTGIVSIPTPAARIVLGVEVRSATAREAQAEAARRSEAVVAAVRGFDVEELQTSRISLAPEYVYEARERRLVGFTATNLVSFRLAAERAGGLLDAAVRAGASRIDSLSLTADEEDLAAAQQQALAEAARQARNRARIVLAALGLEEAEIVRIQVGDRSDRPLPVMLRAMDALEAAPETPVLAGRAEVRAEVTLEIRYR